MSLLLTITTWRTLDECRHFFLANPWSNPTRSSACHEDTSSPPSLPVPCASPPYQRPTATVYISDHHPLHPVQQHPRRWLPPSQQVQQPLKVSLLLLLDWKVKVHTILRPSPFDNGYLLCRPHLVAKLVRIQHISGPEALFNR